LRVIPSAAKIRLQVRGTKVMTRQSKTSRQHLQLLLSHEEATALDKYCERHRLPTRISAVHALLKRGLGLQEREPKSPVADRQDPAVTRPMTRAWRRL
jgi:hypothetical protein